AEANLGGRRKSVAKFVRTGRSPRRKSIAYNLSHPCPSARGKGDKSNFHRISPTVGPENCVILVDPIALGTAESTFIAGAAWVQRSTIRLLPYRCHSDDSADRRQYMTYPRYASANGAQCVC